MALENFIADTFARALPFAFTYVPVGGRDRGYPFAFDLQSTILYPRSTIFTSPASAPHLLRVGVFDLLVNLQRGFGQWQCAIALAELIESEAHVEGSIAFPATVANLARDDETLFIKHNSASGSSQSGSLSLTEK